VDYGDLPVVRWQPDHHQRRPHNLQAVLGVLRETTRRVGAILGDWWFVPDSSVTG
jgi:hypothetical protein